ncbi:MAG: peptidoglycan D,D-transpeptidase FtsI family protein [bacterium]
MLLVLIVAKYLLFTILFLYLWRLLLPTVESLKTVFSFRRRKELSVVLWVVACAFLTLLIHQAYWQLFVNSPYFNATRKLHDPRPWIIEATTIKGNIYDRHHEPSKVFAGYTANRGELPRRYYPLREAASHLIGYSDVERDKAGLEKYFFERLMGWTRGTKEENNTYINNTYFRIQPLGNDIVLSLDYELQRTAYEALAGSTGAVVAIEPATGDVLVLVSSPGFHPDSVSVDDAWLRIVTDEQGKPLYNRALKGRYPPGSTFKTIVACAAVAKGLDPKWAIGPEGYRPPGVRRKRVFDHERASYRRRGQVWRGHGEIDMTRALVKSSNAFYARLGVAVGDTLMHEIANRFGFNQAVEWNTSRPELQDGVVAFRSSFPPTESAHELAWSCIGQEKVLATPLQLALVAAAIANDGVLMKPKLELHEPPQIWHRVVSAETAKKVQKMMRDVVWTRGGTAWRLQMQEVEAAGKTGTAEINMPIRNGDGTLEPNIVNHALFISFAPVENAKIAIAVVVEGGGYGGAAAAPVARQIFLKAHELGYFDETNGVTNKD